MLLHVGFGESCASFQQTLLWASVLADVQTKMASWDELSQSKPTNSEHSIALQHQTWNFARVLFAEDFCQIVEGFLEY